MPKIIKVGQCFTELFTKNSGTVFWDTVYIYRYIHVQGCVRRHRTLIVVWQ